MIFTNGKSTFDILMDLAIADELTASKKKEKESAKINSALPISAYWYQKELAKINAPPPVSGYYSQNDSCVGEYLWFLVKLGGVGGVAAALISPLISSFEKEQVKIDHEKSIVKEQYAYYKAVVTLPSKEDRSEYIYSFDITTKEGFKRKLLYKLSENQPVGLAVANKDISFPLNNCSQKSASISPNDTLIVLGEERINPIDGLNKKEGFVKTVNVVVPKYINEQQLDSFSGEAVCFAEVMVTDLNRQKPYNFLEPDGVNEWGNYIINNSKSFKRIKPHGKKVRVATLERVAATKVEMNDYQPIRPAITNDALDPLQKISNWLNDNPVDKKTINSKPFKHVKPKGKKVRIAYPKNSGTTKVEVKDYQPTRPATTNAPINVAKVFG